MLNRRDLLRSLFALPGVALLGKLPGPKWVKCGNYNVYGGTVTLNHELSRGEQSYTEIDVAPPKITRIEKPYSPQDRRTTFLLNGEDVTEKYIIEAADSEQGWIRIYLQNPHVTHRRCPALTTDLYPECGIKEAVLVTLFGRVELIPFDRVPSEESKSPLWLSHAPAWR